MTNHFYNLVFGIWIHWLIKKIALLKTTSPKVHDKYDNYHNSKEDIITDVSVKLCI